VDVGFGEHEYATVEHAFQAAKATTEWQHHAVRACGTPGFAKQAGRQVTLRPDWEEVKYDIMVKCLREKFKIKMFKRELLSTGHRELREDSPTDFEWGARNSGKNLLGKALMQIRQELHDSQ